MLTSLPIAVLYLGGHPGITSQRSVGRWFDDFTELNMLLKPTPVFLAKRLQTMPPTDTAAAARWIRDHWKEFSGFIVILDRAQVLYHANLLSFMLGPIGKPVVCTSVLEVSEDKGIDVSLKSQLLHTAITVVTPLSGTMMVNDHLVVPVHHARLRQAAKGTVIRSADDFYYGQIDFGVNLTPQALALSAQRPTRAPYFASHVAWQHWRAALTQPANPKQLTGMIIENYDASIDELLATDLPRSIPSLLIGEDGMAMYARRRFELLPPLTSAAATAKFVWTIGRLKRFHLPLSLSRVVDAMQTPLVNELLTLPV